MKLKKLITILLIFALAFDQICFSQIVSSNAMDSYTLAPETIFTSPYFSSNEPIEKAQLLLLDKLLREETIRNGIFDNDRFPKLQDHDREFLGTIYNPQKLIRHNDNVVIIKTEIKGILGELIFFRDVSRIEKDDRLGLLIDQDVLKAQEKGYFFRAYTTDPTLYKSIKFQRTGTIEDPLRVVLVMPRSPYQKEKPTRLPHGLMTLASCLRDKGYLTQIAKQLEKRDSVSIDEIPNIDVRIIDLQAEDEDFDVEKTLEEYSPDLVGVSAMTPLFNNGLSILKTCARVIPNAVRVIGGVHISSFSEDYDYITSTMQKSDIQISIVREGEEVLLELVLRLINKRAIINIPGAFVKNYTKGEPFVSRGVGNKRKKLVDFDQMPLPVDSLDLINTSGYATEKDRDGKDIGICGVIMTSRGCPYNCIFCGSHCVFSRKLQFLSSQRVIEEIQKYYDQGIRSFYFMDDNFSQNPKRLIEIANLIVKKDLDIEYKVMARASSITEEVSAALKRSGCVMVALGVETGDEELLKAIEKATTKKHIFNATKFLQSSGIPVKHYLMVGLPNQDWNSIRKTVEFILETNPDNVNVSIAIPYPGSALYKAKSIKVNELASTDEFLHEPEGPRKIFETQHVITQTDVMSSVEIKRARELLLTLFHNRKDKGVVRKIISEITYREQGVISASEALTEIVNNEELFNDTLDKGFSLFEFADIFRRHSKYPKQEIDSISNNEMKILVKLGILQQDESDKLVFRFSDMIRCKDKNQVRKLILYLLEKDMRILKEPFALDIFALDEEEKIKSIGIVRVLIANFVTNEYLFNTQVKEKININIWKGYFSPSQKPYLTKIKNYLAEKNINVNFRDIETLIDISSVAKENDVFILPYNPLGGLNEQQKKDLNSSNANILYINTEEDNKIYDLALGGALIAIAKAYADNDEEMFYRLYNLLTDKKCENRISLMELKNNPDKAIEILKFVLHPIKAENPEQIRFFNNMLEEFLTYA